MAAPTHIAPLAGAPAASPRVPFQRPEPPAPEAIMAYYTMAEEARYYSNGGPCSRMLTERLETYLGGDAFVVPVGNCTVGLMAALRAACGAPEGERTLVITPAYTFT